MLKKTDGLYDSFFNRTVFRAGNSDNKISLEKIFKETKIGIVFSIAMIFLFTFASFHYSAAVMVVSGIIMLGLTYTLYSSDNKYAEAEKRFEALACTSGFFYASFVQACDNLFITVYAVSCLLYTYSAIITVKENNDTKSVIKKCMPCILIICCVFLINSSSFLDGNILTNIVGFAIITAISGIAGFNAMYILNKYLPKLEEANAREEYAYTIASVFLTIPITWMIDAYEATRA